MSIPTISTTAAAAAEYSLSPAAAAAADYLSSPADEEFSMAATQAAAAAAAAASEAVHFSSGNPRIEETRGIMFLYPQHHDDGDGDGDDNSNLPVGRKPLVCVLAVPNHMTYADFYRFCGSFIQHMLEMRIVRNDGVEDRYSVLIRFDDQRSADDFFKHFNGKSFSSLEDGVCCVLYTVDVQYTGSIEHTQGSLAGSAEQPSCPVCLERLDQDSSGILTTICNHSFHCYCISKWTDSSCPVCRYCQLQPEKSTCSVCGTPENLWICVICGFVGCGRYKEGHAIRHWKETQHCYSLEVETQRAWDYVGDNYVHRLIQSKTDGKLVELNFHCFHADHSYGNCECSADSGIDEALFSSKFDAVICIPSRNFLLRKCSIVEEYNDLLTSQLENQRKYFESLLLEAKVETEREIAEAIEKSVKLQKLQSKLDRCVDEKKFVDDVDEYLKKNQDMWKAKIRQTQEREQAAVRQRDLKIQTLEEQLQDLIVRIETQKPDSELQGSTANDIRGGTVLLGPAEGMSSSRNNNRKHAARNRKG